MALNGCHTCAGVYYSEGYWRAAGLLERDGKLHVFRYGEAIVPLVVRPLPESCGPGFDAVSPYDFCGPLLNRESPGEVWQALCAWARQRRIIAAFLRFHPFCGHAERWQTLNGLEIVHSADNVVVGLSDDDTMLSLFKPQVLRDVKVARRAGVTCSVERAAARGMDAFVPLYWASMDRLGAEPYYRFPSRFFDSLIQGVGEVVKFAWATIDGDSAAAALLVLDDQTAFYYLACSSELGRKSCAMNLLVVESARWLHGMGYERFHLGGGSPALRHFKERFGPGRVPYCVGRAVFDAQRYAELSAGISTDFFPAFRAAQKTATDV